MKIYILTCMGGSFLLSIAMCAFFYCIAQELYFCSMLSLFCICSAIYFLYRRQTKLIMKAKAFINAMNHSDLSIRNSMNNDSLMQELYEESEIVLEKARKRNKEKEIELQFKELILKNIDTGILIFDNAEKLIWINEAALKELQFKQFKDLQELSLYKPKLTETIRNLEPGNIKTIQIRKDGIVHDFAINAIGFYRENDYIRLITLKNIHSVLEQKEMLAWQNMIRVLTHEIMNSITPIISVSETLTERIATESMNEKNFEQMRQALEVIHRRSSGLLGFVENYRKLSRISLPTQENTPVDLLMNDIQKLHPKIHYKFNHESSDNLFIDRGQIDQVLLNLIKNAVEACRDTVNPEISVETSYGVLRQQFQIRISDNGVGITPETMQRIFLPFFTTKPNGSGIGLSLCKQIMTYHGGSVNCNSEPEKGSSFILLFPSHLYNRKKIQ